MHIYYRTWINAITGTVDEKEPQGFLMTGVPGKIRFVRCTDPEK